MRKRSGQALRRMAALLCAAVTFLAAACASGSLALPALRLSPPVGQTVAAPRTRLLTVLAMGGSVCLLENRAAAEKLQGGEDAQNEEGTTLPAEPDTAAAPAAPKGDGSDDNGIPAKTLIPAGRSGYLVWNQVYVSNTTGYAPDLAALMQTPPAARLGTAMPQVLILHTHGSEAYTMPGEAAYSSSGDCRTADTRYNVVRVGDEIASVLEEYGISVLHDRTLYDTPEYTGAYDRAAVATEAYLAKYPSICFVLDVHRDAITDSGGQAYKVVSAESGGSAAQLTLVVGSDGGGLSHPNWRENLKLAVQLQEHTLEQYPTLMRPILLRNSRYNEHESTGALLVEVGAAGNSLDEALAAARLFAGSFAQTLNSLRAP